MKFRVKTQSAVTLRLRIPAWCDGYTLFVDGKVTDTAPAEGYVDAMLSSGEHEVTLVLREDVRVSHAEIDGKPYLSVEYGPLLMAHDTHFGGELWQTVSSDVKPRVLRADDTAIVRMEADEMTLVDFASAGGNDPENDLYTVFIPER